MESEQNELPDLQEYNNYNDFEQYFTKKIDDHLQDVQTYTSDWDRRYKYLHHFNMKHFLNPIQETTEQTDQGDIDNIKQQIKKNTLTLHEKYISQKNFKAFCKIDRPDSDTIKHTTITIAMENNDDNNSYQIVYKSNGNDQYYRYTKGIFNNEQQLTQGHYRAMSWDNTRAEICNGTWLPTKNKSSIHTSGTYIVINRDNIHQTVTIDICYDYKNNDAPNITVGGGSVFRIKLLQEKGKYTLKEIKKGNMIEDKVDENSLSETNENAIREVIDDEMTGKSLRDTLIEEPELFNLLKQIGIINDELYNKYFKQIEINIEDGQEGKDKYTYGCYCCGIDNDQVRFCGTNCFTLNYT
ncbi:MAG: hypothetical protein IJT15_03560 [Rickettsiales bacterium]|nr:hypothetical protein [Rickettsiales bacterium]